MMGAYATQPGLTFGPQTYNQFRPNTPPYMLNGGVQPFAMTNGVSRPGWNGQPTGLVNAGFQGGYSPPLTAAYINNSYPFYTGAQTPGMMSSGVPNTMAGYRPSMMGTAGGVQFPTNIPGGNTQFSQPFTPQAGYMQNGQGYVASPNPGYTGSGVYPGTTSVGQGGGTGPSGVVFPTSIPGGAGGGNPALAFRQQGYNAPTASPTSYPMANGAGAYMQNAGNPNAALAQQTAGQGQLPQGVMLPTSVPGMGPTSGNGAFPNQMGRFHGENFLYSSLPFTQGLISQPGNGHGGQQSPILGQTQQGAIDQVPNVNVQTKAIDIGGPLIQDLHSTTALTIAEADAEPIKMGDVLIAVNINRVANDPIMGWVFQDQYKDRDVNSDGVSDPLVRINGQAYRNLGQHPSQEKLEEIYGDGIFVTANAPDITRDGVPDQLILKLSEDGSEQSLLTPFIYSTADGANEMDKFLAEAVADYEENQDSSKVYDNGHIKIKIHGIESAGDNKHVVYTERV